MSTRSDVSFSLSSSACPLPPTTFDPPAPQTSHSTTDNGSSRRTMNTDYYRSVTTSHLDYLQGNGSTAIPLLFNIGSSSKQDCIASLKKHQACSDILHVRFTGTNSVVIEVSSAKAAHLLLSSHKGTLITSPETTTLGVLHGVPTDFSAQQIVTETSSDVPIIQARRFFKRNINSSPTPTETVLLTFIGTKKPNHVTIDLQRFRISEYKPRPTRCFKCQRFGHISTSCRGSSRCLQCGSSDHQQCNEQPRCPNCKGPHKASDRTCKVYTAEKSLLQKAQVQHVHISQLKSSYSAAVTGNTPTPPKKIAVSISKSTSQHDAVPAKTKTPPPRPPPPTRTTCDAA